ncbi:MAG TPA: VTT domain-containing protein [Stellaceae bacterium]|nr:VTT domain-containing protein [Stellaceae bacterium]
MLATLLSAVIAANPFVQTGLIIAATFILEDPATVMVGMMSADRLIAMPTALVALYLGIILGDLGLYGLGFLAARQRWARRLVPVATHDSVRGWLGPRLVTTVATCRFLPGLRLPVYTACGFFRMPLARFAAAVVGATLVWTTLLFGAAYAFGAATAERLGLWRWPLGIALALAAILLSRALARRRVPELAR